MTFLRKKPLLLLIWLLPVLAASGIVYQAPVWLEPQTLTIPLEPGQTLTLGHEALWAPQASSEHVLLRRTLEGGWRLAHIAAGKQVLWQPAGSNDERSIRQWPLTTGSVFAVGTQQIAVLATGTAGLVLHTDDQRWEYDGIRLHREGQPLPECYEGWRVWVRNGLAALGLGRWVQRPLRLGGGVYCADRLGLAEAAVDTVLITVTRSGFMLCPGNAARPDGPPVTIAVGAPEAELLWQRSIPLAIHDRLMIGRTRYEVTQIDPVLELTVRGRAQRRLAGTTDSMTAAVQVQWRPMAWLMMPSGLGGWLLLLTYALVLWLWKQRRLDHLRWSVAALVPAGACLVLYSNTQTMPSLWPYLFAWPALGIWLWTVRSPWSAALLAALTLLLGAGLATLLQLGVGAGDSGWLRFGGKNAALAGAFGWLAWSGWCFWQWWQPDNVMKARLARWGLRWLGSTALVLLALQVGFGDETGWGGFQPFEWTKLALVTAAGYALLMLKVRRRAGNVAKLSWRLPALGPVVLLAVTISFALVFLRDFSPLALLLVWTLILVWAYGRTHSRPVWRWSGGVAVVALALLLVAGMARLHDRPEDFPLDFQQDRIRVWAAPEQHPHSSYQLRRALEAIRAGGWWGTAWKETMNGRAMMIPVVESDFTPAFFLNRYGGVAALTLVGVQTVFIFVLIGIADRTWIGIDQNDDQWMALRGFAYFALYGGAALLGAHILVSWGVNLGFLPVMGQPMPLLSAAGSHVTLFVLPIVALAVAVEEKNHAPSS